jgi:hypothetical protein
VLQQQLLNTQKELDKAYGLVDLLLLENQKLRDATTEFYEYVKVELQKSHLVSEPLLEAQSLKGKSQHEDQTNQVSVLQIPALVEDPTTLLWCPQFIPRGKLSRQLTQVPNLSVTKSVPPSSECPICSNIEHELLNCPKFKTLETNEKLEIATSSRSCFHCLRRGHRFRQCRNDKGRLCGVNNCQKYEHPLLHSDLNTNQGTHLRKTLSNTHDEFWGPNDQKHLNLEFWIHCNSKDQVGNVEPAHGSSNS